MIQGLNSLFFVFFVAVNLLYLVLTVFALLDIRNRRFLRMVEYDHRVLSDMATPPITLVAPAFNEEMVIVESVTSFLQLQYPTLRVIVVNDGSRDATLARVLKAFECHPTPYILCSDVPTKPIREIYRSARDPRLWVIDKENGGKADALNAGLNACQTPLVCCVDADTLVDRKALLRMVEPFLYDDHDAVAVGGSVCVVNGSTVVHGRLRQLSLPSSALGRFQLVEYLRSFLLGRVGYNRMGGNLIVSGAFGLFFREALVEVGGYRSDTVGEDMDLVVRLHRHFHEKGLRYAVIHLPDPVCYTEVPEKASILAAQRDRWHRGLAEVLMYNWDMIGNARYGLVGTVVVPVFVVFELLGPLVELVGYCVFIVQYALGMVNLLVFVLFFVVSLLAGMLFTFQSVLTDELNARWSPGDRPPLEHPWRYRVGLLVTAFLENFGYRQFTLLARTRGLWHFVRGVRSWGRMTRAGFQGRPS
jgi:cellulose synthase/poly-beta-1,6-N-acetylglucosamine synthase-like glycosyltransferase